MPQILVLCNDLFFTTKITGTAKALERETTVVADGRQVKEDDSVQMLIVDLNCPGTAASDLLRLRSFFPVPKKAIAFGSHVEVDRLKDARSAGFDKVLPRSELSAGLVDLLREG